MTIKYHIFNSINSKEILSIEVPWDYRKAIKGFYSGLWKHIKSASAIGLDKRLIKGKIKITNTDSNRMEISFPGGLKLNSPFDLNPIDFKIINLHLEAAKLAIS